MLKKLLTEYTNLIDKIGQENLDRMEELEKDIKTTAREAGDDEVAKAVTSSFSIRVDRKFKKYYDWALIKKYAQDNELTLIKDQAIKIEVDKVKFEELVKADMVSLKLKQKAFREEQMTPSVTILRTNGK